jgi:hypothetical protein
VRRAARTDGTQAEIIAALRRVGVSAEYIKQPFDLVIYNPRKQETAFLECKTPRPTSEGGEHGLTKAQVEFIERWPGKVYVARSAEDAVRQVLGEEAFA